MDKNLLFGIGALLAGVLCLIKVFLDRKGERLSGTISGFVSRDGVAFPVVKFNYMGKEMEMRAANGDNKKIKEGDSVEIIYRGEKAEYVNIVGDNRDIVISVGLLVCGVGLIICALLK